MKSQMAESVNITIETLDNSKENLINESSLEAAEKLTTNLEAIKEKISSAKTEDNLLQIKQELGALYTAAPDNIKVILSQSMGPGSGLKNGSEKISQGFENGTERRPEMMTNRSQLPRSGNATIDGNGMLGQGPKGMTGKGSLTDENGKEAAKESGFSGKLIDALKSLLN